MFSFGSKDKVIEKARKIFLGGKVDKAIETLESAIDNQPSDLPLILEIMHIYGQVNKFKELVIWARKGEGLSKEAKEHIVKEVEDIFYGSGKPVELFEYLVEKNIENKDFENAWKILENTSKDAIKNLIQKESIILDNIRKKEALSQRDKIHFYIIAICNEFIDLKTSMAIFEEIFSRFPDEEEIIYNELERLNRVIYGDPFIQFSLSKFLLSRKNYERGVELIRRSVEREKSLLKEAVKIVESYKNESTIELLCDLYILSGEKEKAIETIKSFKGKEAIKKYEELARVNPNNPEILIRLAEAYIDNQKYEDGVNIFKKVMEINRTFIEKEKLTKIIDEIKDNSDVLFDIAEILLEMKEYKDAYNAVKKAFTISPTAEEETMSFIKRIETEFPDFVEPKILKSQILGRKKEFDEAIDEIEKLIEKDENIVIAKELLFNIYKENPENSKSAILYSIINLNENFDKGFETLNKIIKEEPNAIPYILKQLDSWIRRRRDYIPYVIKVYENFDKKDFPPFVLHFAMAEAYFLNGDYEKAKTNYILSIKESPDKAGFIFKTIRSHPESKENYLLLIELLVMLNKFQIVEELINVVIDKYPDITNSLVTLFLTSMSKVGKNPGIYRIIVKILFEQNYFDEVIEYGSKAISILDEKDCGTIFFYLASALGEKGGYDESIKYFKKAIIIDASLVEPVIKKIESYIRKNVKNIEMLLLLYKLYRDRKDIKNAGNILFEAYRLNPSYYKEVVENFQKLIEISPIEPVLHLKLGEILIENGDEKGFDHLEKAIRFDKSIIQEVVNALESAKGKEVKIRAILFKTKLLKSLNKYEDVLKTLLQIYKTYPNFKSEVISELMDVVQKVDIEDNTFKDLLEIFWEEKRTRNIIEISDSFIKRHPEKSEYVLKCLDEVFQDNYTIPVLFLKAKLLKNMKRYNDTIKILRDIFDRDNDTAESIIGMIDFYNEDSNKLLADCFIHLNKPQMALNLVKNLKGKEKTEYLEKLIKILDNEDIKRELAETYIIENRMEDAKNILSNLKSKTEREYIMLYFAGEDINVPIDKIIEFKKELLLKKLEFTEDNEEKFSIALKLRRFDIAREILNSFSGDKKIIKMAWLELYEGRFFNALELVKGIKDDEAKRILFIASSRLGFEKVSRKLGAIINKEKETINILNPKKGVFKLYWR